MYRICFTPLFKHISSLLVRIEADFHAICFQRDCADGQARLSLRWSPMTYLPKSHVDHSNFIGTKLAYVSVNFYMTPNRLEALRYALYHIGTFKDNITPNLQVIPQFGQKRVKFKYVFVPYNYFVFYSKVPILKHYLNLERTLISDGLLFVGGSTLVKLSFAYLFDFVWETIFNNFQS